MRRRGLIRAQLAVIKGLLILLLVQLTQGTYAQWGLSRTLARIKLARLACPSIIPPNETRCYGELGCLTIDARFRNSSNEATNLLPKSRKSVNTTFVLYNRVHWKKGMIIAVEDLMSIERTGCDFNKPTKFIIHGFDSSPQNSWMGKMINELLVHGDYSVIVVDWEKGASYLYPQSAANSRLIGLEIAHLINHLRTNYRLKLKDVHLIGHSLGAHAAGFAGAKLEGRIGRITGLDPARPYFESMPIDLRLDPTDARFVDVIHTATKELEIPGIPRSFKRLAFSMNMTCGHLDFYPNGGDVQPGCESSEKSRFHEQIQNYIRDIVLCSHRRAAELFIESINSRSEYAAVSCRDYDSFRRGECFDCSGNNFANCAIMGYHADTNRALKLARANGRDVSNLIGKRFYLLTSGEIPYCRLLRRLSVKLLSPLNMENRVQGYLNVNLHQRRLTRSIRLDIEKFAIRNRLAISVLMPPTASEILNMKSIQSIHLFGNSGDGLGYGHGLQVTSVIVETMDSLDGRKRVTDGFMAYCPVHALLISVPALWLQTLTTMDKVDQSIIYFFGE